MIFIKKLIRRAASLMTALVMSSMAIAGGTTVFASDSEDYIKFINSGDDRIDSDGTFTFYFDTQLKSDHFIADGSSITIETEAEMFAETGANAGHFRDSSYIYKVTLYKETSIFQDKKIGSFQGCGDGTIASERFVGIEEGEEYYFQLDVVYPLNLVQYDCVFDGTGKVYNVTIL